MIPKQLQNDKYRFIKIKKKRKIPVEKEWQKTNNYKWNDKKLQQWIKDSGNYGIINTSGDLLVIDADSEKISKLITDKLPKTFTVQTSKPGKYHIYYTCRKMTNVKKYFEDNMGDIRFSNSSFYTICPGSIHPNGKVYKVKIDVPIIEITEKKVINSLSKYFKKDKEGRGIKHTLEGVKKGARDDTLFKFACKLKHDGYSYEEALSITMQRNNNCEPPLPEANIQKCVDSAYKYENSDKKSEIPNNAPIKEKDAIAILQDDNLLFNIVQEVKKLVVGNDDVILALVNKICLRLVINANPTSSNVLISDDSGSGKDWLTKCVCAVLLPKRKYYHQTDISEKLLNYWTVSKKDGGTFDGSILHLEDPGENVLTAQAFKVRASGENSLRVVDKGRAKYIHIEGKPVMIVTSLKATIDDEGCRRWDSLRMDKSKRVTQLMKKQYMEITAGLRDTTPDKNLRDALQHNLLRKSVMIPYAIALIDTIPDDLIMRTQQQKLTDYIKASAVLHQYQREKDKDGNIIAILDDYEYARFCFLILGDLYGMVLSRDEEEVINVLKEFGNLMPIREICAKCRMGKDWMYIHLPQMKQKGLLREESPFDNLANKPVQCYGLATGYDFLSGLSMPTVKIIIDRMKKISNIAENQKTDSFERKNKTDNRTDNQTTGEDDRKVYKGEVGCRQFEVCVRELNKARVKNGLKAFYLRDQNNRKPTKDINSSNLVNGSNSVARNVPENQKTTTDNQTDLSLFQQIQNLLKYIADNQKSGHKINRAFLEHKFSKSFIQHCIDNKIIQKKGGDEWEIR